MQNRFRMDMRPDSAPKYRLIARDIMNRIESGHYKYGGRLPSEAVLAKSHAVSLGTVQKALGILAERGVVDRRHGSGTFVKSTSGPKYGNSTPAENIQYFRFKPPHGDHIPKLKNRVISVSLSGQSGIWSDFLGDDRSITKLCRVVRVDEAFEFINLAFVLTKSARSLTSTPLDALHGAPLREYLHRTYGIVSSRQNHSIKTSPMPSVVYEHTHTAQGAIGMEWYIRVWNTADKPVIFHQNFLPPTDYQLLFD